MRRRRRGRRRDCQRERVAAANCSNVTLSFALDGQAFHDITEATAALDEIHHTQPYYDDDRELKWFDPLAEHENRRRRTAFGERPTVTVDDLFEDGYPDDWVATSRRGGRRSARAARRRLGVICSEHRAARRRRRPPAAAIDYAATWNGLPPASGDIDGVYGDAVDGVYT